MPQTPKFLRRKVKIVKEDIRGPDLKGVGVLPPTPKPRTKKLKSKSASSSKLIVKKRPKAGDWTKFQVGMGKLKKKMVSKSQIGTPLKSFVERPGLIERKDFKRSVTVSIPDFKKMHEELRPKPKSVGRPRVKKSNVPRPKAIYSK